MHLEPNHDNLQLLLERDPVGELVMLNLLRFKDVADYAAYPELAPPRPISGRDAYNVYMAHTLPFLTASGGSLEFIGEGGHYFIGPTEERWDLALLVRQSSLEAFFAFAQDEGYLAGLGHRSAALADSRLLPLTPQVSS
ncbi:MAG: DUF1330 domain-containing protein [Acidimicrobiales bacterium]